MTGAGTDSCTVTLNVAAASGGFAVTLASNNSAVTVPASVTVAAGSATASFTATVSGVSTAQTVTLTASANSVAKTFALQLGAGVPTLRGNATTIAFGNVNLNTPATNTDPDVDRTAPLSVSAATVSGTGFTISGGPFPITLTVLKRPRSACCSIPSRQWRSQAEKVCERLVCGIAHCNRPDWHRDWSSVQDELDLGCAHELDGPGCRL